MAPVKPTVTGTVASLPLLDMPGQPMTPEKVEKARRAGMFDFDPLERSYFDIANGSAKASFGTNTDLARAMVKSAALSLEGVIRDVERWAQDPGYGNLQKLIRGLQHANKEVDEVSRSRDVQIERWSLTEIGPDIHVGYLFHELSELRARFGELLEAVGRSNLEQLARASRAGSGTEGEARELFQQLGKLLTEGRTLESHVLWHPIPQDQGLTPMSTVFPGASNNDKKTTKAYQLHLEAENLLASGDAREAVTRLHESACCVADTSASCGPALIYLADALVLTGLDKKSLVPLTHKGLDAGALYYAGVMRVRSGTKPSDEALGRLVAHVHAQLVDLGQHDLATKTTREALSPGPILLSNVQALLHPDA